MIHVIVKDDEIKHVDSSSSYCSCTCSKCWASQEIKDCICEQCLCSNDPEMDH